MVGPVPSIVRILIFLLTISPAGFFLMSGAHIMSQTETRRRIFSAATGLRAIAAAAGIATGTLFNNFPTKEAMAADPDRGEFGKCRL
jgi:hypothetical protein